MATPLVNGIEDLHWILCLPESWSWIALQLEPDTLNYTLNIDDDWVTDRSNVSYTEPGARFTPVADLYNNTQILVHMFTAQQELGIFTSCP